MKILNTVVTLLLTSLQLTTAYGVTNEYQRESIITKPKASTSFLLCTRILKRLPGHQDPVELGLTCRSPSQPNGSTPYPLFERKSRL